MQKDRSINKVRRAIVIGGSMTGMLAAKVLSEHFDEVILIERDVFPEAVEPRSGVPQARHAHALLARGQRILEGFFPGLKQELVAAGARELNVGKDVAWLTPQGWGIKFETEVTGLSASRPLIDHVIRRRVAALPNVRMLQNREVTELITRDGGDAIIGVTLRHRLPAETGNGGEEWLAAELVIETSGRASKLPQMLASIGYVAPEESVINAHLGYASRVYEMPAAFQAEWKAAFVQAAPPIHIRAGLLFPIEGNCWLVTLIGGDRDYPPTDDEGFLAFARSLRSPLLYNAIQQARPLSAIASHRGTENRQRHYERLTRWPDRLLVLGDSACAFNPVYGQGMTTSAIGAELLSRMLRAASGNWDGLARRFQRELAKQNADPWMLSTGEDYRYRHASGGAPTAINRFMHRYIDQVLWLTTRNAHVRRRFIEVQGMLKSPKTLFLPVISLRVLWNVIREAINGKSGPKAAAVSAPTGIPNRISTTKF